MTLDAKTLEALRGVSTATVTTVLLKKGASQRLDAPHPTAAP